MPIMCPKAEQFRFIGSYQSCKVEVCSHKDVRLINRGLQFYLVSITNVTIISIVIGLSTVATNNCGKKRPQIRML